MTLSSLTVKGLQKIGSQILLYLLLGQLLTNRVFPWLEPGYLQLCITTHTWLVLLLHWFLICWFLVCWFLFCWFLLYWLLFCRLFDSWLSVSLLLINWFLICWLLGRARLSCRYAITFSLRPPQKISHFWM